MKEKKFRNEIKHYINFLDYLEIKTRLNAVMKLDKNSGNNNEYLVKSIYFDNYKDKVLLEKINGLNRREKFRIRTYNNNHSFIRLEKKSKLNGFCSKDSEIITKEQCEDILKGNIEFLKNSDKELFVEFYSKIKGDLLKPKTIVQYKREAYVYPLGNVRITFDKDIKTGISNIDFLNDKVPMINAIDNKVVVLEVKYDEFLPEIIQDIIQTKNRRASSISKYVACRLYG